MEKEQIIKIFRDEAKKIVWRENKDNNNDLKLKLLQTTEKFVRTFDYELPKVRGLKEKIKKIIKRVIRKATRFITKPYAENMLSFQECLCELLGMYIDKYDDIDQKLEKLCKRQDELERSLNTRERIKD